MEKIMVRPIGKRLLIIPQNYEAEKISVSGIVYDTEKTNSSKTSKAKVLSVGDEVTKIQNGDEIFYESFSGHEVNIDGKDYTIIEEINVIGVINE